MRGGPFLTASFLGLSFGCAAQTMSLVGGTLEVSPGTTLRVNGPITWEINPGASVLNDGLIDLGTQAILMESDGFPVVGSGLEVAIEPTSAPLTGVDPGGLGLTITTAYADGGLMVERGHLPALAPTGVEGIARWYRVSTPQQTNEALLVQLHYDLTELNGIAPLNLSLFEAPSYSGTWVPVVSTGNVGAQTLDGTTLPPTDHITAFDLDLATSILPDDVEPGITVWPTMVEESITIGMPLNAALSKAELFDALGRSVWIHNARPGTTGRVTLSIPELASGTYSLVINASSLHKLIRR